MSLFKDDSCCGHKEDDKKPKHSSCVSGMLDSLANGSCGNYCAMAQPTVIRVVLKGADQPLNVNGQTLPGVGTDFTLVRYDRKTNCVVLAYSEGVAPAAITRTYVLDSRCICGIICYNNTPGVAVPGIV